MPNPMSLDELVVFLNKIQRDIKITSQRVEVAVLDLAAHRDAQNSKSRRATKKKKK